MPITSSLVEIRHHWGVGKIEKEKKNLLRHGAVTKPI
jgi:hypothetical protein